MPSQHIVRDIRTLIKTSIMPVVPKRWVKQFDFGLQAYGLRSFASANGNARKVVANPNTASTKTDRLLANLKLAEHFGRAFDALYLITPRSFVNIDYSDFNGLMVLAGAVQTRKGRAIPCMVETTYSDRLPAHEDAPPREQKLRAARAEERKQLALTAYTIRSLQALANRLGFWPKLVFDRGFGGKEIIKLLCKERATFYIRLKADRLVEFIDNQGETTEAWRAEASAGRQGKQQIKDLHGDDTTIMLYGYRLRVVRSRRPGRNSKRREPWYVLTNDFQSTPNRILRVYRHRFEIEETFKDLKHVFELKRTRLNKPNSLKVILWFVSIGISLLYIVTRPDSTVERWRNPKKWRSWLRAAYERLEREVTTALWGGLTGVTTERGWK